MSQPGDAAADGHRGSPKANADVLVTPSREDPPRCPGRVVGHLAVVVTAAGADRVSEGLRAGLGLGLRGDPVEVVLTGPAARYGGADGGGDPRIARALATLAQLGRPARVVGPDQARAVAGRARAVEVWTDGGSPGEAAAGPRRVTLAGPGESAPVETVLAPAGERDARSVIERLFGAERTMVW